MATRKRKMGTECKKKRTKQNKTSKKKPMVSEDGEGRIKPLMQSCLPSQPKNLLIYYLRYPKQLCRHD